MNKWLRRILFAGAFACLALGILYECATHVGRGWLRGEAFYEGRPTSYWRSRCDDWLTRFQTPEEAARWIPPGISVPIVDDDQFPADFFAIRPIQRTWWRQVSDRFQSQEERMHEDWPPKVLFGYPSAEPVLDELARAPKYQLLAERALRYAKVYRKMGVDE